MKAHASAIDGSLNRGPISIVFKRYTCVRMPRYAGLLNSIKVLFKPSSITIAEDHSLYKFIYQVSSSYSETDIKGFTKT